MAVLLYRVDERLIHGQVVVGWGAQLHPTRIVVVDDELAGSEWEQELYVLGLPPEIRAEFDTVARARARLPEWRDGAERVILLTRDIGTMRRVAEDGLLAGQDINVGGIHYTPGRQQVLPYVYLSDDDRAELRRLRSTGVTLTARDLPGGRRVDLGPLLDR